MSTPTEHSNQYTAEQLLHDLPRPLLNFLWYLFDTYSVPGEMEFVITLQDGDGSGQRFVIPCACVDITKNFGCHITADIAIRECGTRFFMEYAQCVNC